MEDGFQEEWVQVVEWIWITSFKRIKVSCEFNNLILDTNLFIYKREQPCWAN